jgi:hypothetical protein
MCTTLNILERAVNLGLVDHDLVLDTWNNSQRVRAILSGFEDSCLSKENLGAAALASVLFFADGASTEDYQIFADLVMFLAQNPDSPSNVFFQLGTISSVN